MVKGKHENPTNRNQGHMATSEPNSPTTASPGYLNKPLFLMIIFNFNMSFYILPLFYQKCFQCKSLILSQMFLIPPSINLESFYIYHFICKIFHEIVNFNMFVYLFHEFYQKYFPCKSSMLSENLFIPPSINLKLSLCLSFIYIISMII